jgi:hypothetical protein
VSYFPQTHEADNPRYSASLDKRVMLTGIFNSGLINTENTKRFAQLHAPVGFFLGGPSDIAYANVSCPSLLSFRD